MEIVSEPDLRSPADASEYVKKLRSILRYVGSCDGNMEKGNINLKVNDEVRQDGDLDMMIWKIPEQIAHLSKFYDISAGDLIMTGTPAGVGPIVKGDKLVGTIDHLETLEVVVV